VAYDVENRVAEANGVKYAYSPDNLRIWRGSATLDELTVYSMGQKLGAYNLSVNNGALVATCTGYYEYFGGKMIKNAGGYINQDRLGSIGKFFPYGQERPSATSNGKEKFATYFRDSETGLDYADNRYHSSGDGRFLTPDPFGGSAKLADPGSLNRYAYVGGDPVNNNDPSGLCSINGVQLGQDPDCYITVYAFGLFAEGGGGGDDEPIVCGSAGCMPLHEACSLYGSDFGYGYGCGGDPPPEEHTCAPGLTWFDNIGCDRELNSFAQAVFQQINRNNPAGFVSAMAAGVGLEGAVAGGVAILASAMAAGTEVGGTVVLGSNPTYLSLAEEIGGDAFSMSSEAWGALTGAEQWTVNQAFLDGAITNGSRIVFSNSPTAAVEGTFFWREIQYLASRGYTILEGGAIPPGLP
jgi:RHS repeat-associated protein